MRIPVLSSQTSSHDAEVLLWVGCAGSFDEHYKKVTRAFTKLLQLAKVSFAVLGSEESCSGDPAKRVGNEYLFQMQALSNIEKMNKYGVKKIVTACPHCFNTLKNEYPSLGGHYEVWHHSQYLNKLIKEKRLRIDKQSTRAVTYHDSCYLGRANEDYESPRQLLRHFSSSLREMRRRKSKGLCCGAGGGQMFKEPEKGDQDINVVRTEEALRTRAQVLATACPFCMTMMRDGIKQRDKEDVMEVKDVAELLLDGVREES